MEDRDMKYCKLCLVTDVKMFSLNTPSILQAYSQLVQVDVYEDCQAYYVCYECVSLLRKFEEFRLKCMTASSVLSSIHVDHSKITKKAVQNIDRHLYNLDSKLARCCILLCNSSKQNLAQKNKFDTDVDLLKNDINSDLKIEPYMLEIESKMVACDSNHHTQDEIMSYNTSVSNEIQEDYYDTKGSIEIQKHVHHDTKNSIEILEHVHETKFSIEIQEHVHDTNVSKENQENYHAQPKNSKRKCLVNKRSTEYPTQSSIEINQEQNENGFEDELLLRSRKTNSKNNELRRKQIMAENCKNHFKDYATVVFLTPEDARNEMLLRKESKNYKKNPLKCELCFKGFVFQSAFETHMKKHSPENGKWECKYCHQRFISNDKLTKHMFSFHKRKYICEICPYACYDPTQANAHMNIHKSKNHTAKRKQNVSISDTMPSHNRVEILTEAVCALCGSTFAAPQGLDAHYNLSHRQENIELVGPKCVECDVQFATETAWKRHLVLSSKHTVDNGCEECGEAFPSRAALTIHTIKHHRRQTNKKIDKKIDKRLYFKPPAACKICKQWLTTRSEYKDHMKSQHSPSKPAKVTKVVEKKLPGEQNQFVCEVCGMSNLKSNFHLNHHRLTHTGERPYECRVCGKAFRQPASLYQHENIHTRNRIFQCDTCLKEYYNKSSLVKHIKGHLGIRPYACSLCDKSFPQMFRLRLHINYVHRKEPWPKRDRTKRKTK